MSCQPHSLTSLFLGIPSFLASLSLKTFFSWHFLLSKSHSLGMVFCWHHFSCILLFRIFFFDTSFCGFPWGLLSWHLLWHLFLLASLFSWLSRCYFVLQKLAQRLPSTTVHYKSLHKVLPRTTLYYKACTKYLPKLLCATKLPQSTSQYDFVLQDLHKVLPSTP